METWKKCVETYEVSNKGNIRKMCKSGKYININGSIGNRGYIYFQVQRNEKRINYLIYHLVAEFFISKRPTGLVIDHINRDKLDNSVSNLRYVTQKLNSFNYDRVLTHIPQDTPNRRSLCVQDYARRNKDKIKENQSKILHCDCGSRIIIYGRCRHERSIKHQDYLNLTHQSKV